MDSDKRLNFAIEIAIEAGELARQIRSSPDGLRTKGKGPLDLVTRADLACEALLRRRISEDYPNDGVLGEEAGLDRGITGVWIVDPIDGTTNFSRGMPDWAVSVAFFDGRELTHGVIHAPDLGITAAAVKDGPAKLNDVEINFADGEIRNPPIVSLGYSLRTPLDDYLGRISRLMNAGIEHRRNGAATIGFIGVLSGWVDAYYEANLNIWDAAAGLVILKAAGGHAVHSPIRQFMNEPSAVLADNTKIDELRTLVDC